jgi:hypothetical protein
MGVNDACDPDSGVIIGNFTITKQFVHYFLDHYGYVSNSFHSYAGICEANDNGEHLVDRSACDPDDVAMYALSTSTYSLVSEGGQVTKSFTFDNEQTRSNSNPWGNYEVFPLGQGRNYITAHVCVVPREGASAADGVN